VALRSQLVMEEDVPVGLREEQVVVVKVVGAAVAGVEERSGIHRLTCQAGRS